MQDSSLTIASLPQELITEIILRLPVKYLLQFRCVSKSWLALISSPEFIKAHLKLSANNKDCTHHRLMWRQLEYSLSLKSLLYESHIEASDLDYSPMKNAHKSFRIVGSVNGLICLSGGERDLFLWNPSIRKCRKLPDFGTKLSYKYLYGFGYDEFHDEYKVAVIFYNNSSRHGNSNLVEVVKIYSQMSNSWKSVDCPREELLNVSSMLLSYSGKFVDGKLHWATTNTGVMKYKIWNIISFDLANEKWEKMEQPSCEEGDIFLRTGVLGSNVSVFCYNERKHVSVWVRKEYGVNESWTKMFTINYAPHHRYATPFFMSNKGEILVGFGPTIMIYNPKDASFSPKVINLEGRNPKIYIESLVSPFPMGRGTNDATNNTSEKSLDEDSQVRNNL